MIETDTMLKQLLVITALLLIFHQSIAAERIVKCQIDNNGGVTYKGQCLFLAGEKGSFSLLNPKAKPNISDKHKQLFSGIMEVSVSIIEKNQAEVRGLTVNDNNSRWGEDIRSEEDTACWVGSDFRICAW